MPFLVPFLYFDDFVLDGSDDNELLGLEHA